MDGKFSSCDSGKNNQARNTAVFKEHDLRAASLPVINRAGSDPGGSLLAGSQLAGSDLLENSLLVDSLSGIDLSANSLLKKNLLASNLAPSHHLRSRFSAENTQEQDRDVQEAIVQYKKELSDLRQEHKHNQLAVHIVHNEGGWLGRAVETFIGYGDLTKSLADEELQLSVIQKQLGQIDKSKDKLAALMDLQKQLNNILLPNPYDPHLKTSVSVIRYEGAQKEGVEKASTAAAIGAGLATMFISGVGEANIALRLGIVCGAGVSAGGLAKWGVKADGQYSRAWNDVLWGGGYGAAAGLSTIAGGTLLQFLKSSFIKSAVI